MTIDGSYGLEEEQRAAKRPRIDDGVDAEVPSFLAELVRLPDPTIISPAERHAAVLCRPLRLFVPFQQAHPEASVARRSEEFQSPQQEQLGGLLTAGSQAKPPGDLTDVLEAIRQHNAETDIFAQVAWRAARDAERAAETDPRSRGRPISVEQRDREQDADNSPAKIVPLSAERLCETEQLLRSPSKANASVQDVACAIADIDTRQEIEHIDDVPFAAPVAPAPVSIVSQLGLSTALAILDVAPHGVLIVMPCWHDGIVDWRITLEQLSRLPQLPRVLSAAQCRDVKQYRKSAMHAGLLRQGGKTSDGHFELTEAAKKVRASLLTGDAPAVLSILLSAARDHHAGDQGESVTRVKADEDALTTTQPKMQVRPTRSVRKREKQALRASVIACRVGLAVQPFVLLLLLPGWDEAGCAEALQLGVAAQVLPAWYHLCSIGGADFAWPTYISAAVNAQIVTQTPSSANAPSRLLLTQRGRALQDVHGGAMTTITPDELDAHAASIRIGAKALALVAAVMTRAPYAIFAALRCWQLNPSNRLNLISMHLERVPEIRSFSTSAGCPDLTAFKNRAMHSGILAYDGDGSGLRLTEFGQWLCDGFFSWDDVVVHLMPLTLDELCMRAATVAEIIGIENQPFALLVLQPLWDRDAASDAMISTRLVERSIWPRICAAAGCSTAWRSFIAAAVRADIVLEVGGANAECETLTLTARGKDLRQQHLRQVFM